MLDALEAVHDDVLAQVDALEAVLRQPAPCRDSLSTVRWRLMRATRNRLKLLDEEIYPALRDVLPDRIAAFRSDDTAKRTASATHIARWHLAHIVADWGGYRAASAAITADIRRRIGDEQQALYPALRRHDPSSSAGTPSGKSTRSPRDRAAGTPPSPPG